MRPLWEPGGVGVGGGGGEIRSACLLTRPHVLMACLLFSPFPRFIRSQRSREPLTMFSFRPGMPQIERTITDDDFFLGGGISIIFFCFKN